MDPKNKNHAPPCHECDAKCCRYVAMEIDRPTCKRDYDHIRWYLLHKNIHIFIDYEGDWYIEFATPCERLTPNSLCGKYEDRPRICRTHGSDGDSCEHTEQAWRQMFKTIEEFEAYLDAKGTAWRWKKPL